MRFAARADVAFLKGVDQAYYRAHGTQMTTERVPIVDLRAAQGRLRRAVRRHARAAIPAADRLRRRAEPQDGQGGTVARVPRLRPPADGRDADRRARRVRRRHLPRSGACPSTGACAGARRSARRVSRTCSPSCCPPCTGGFATCCGGGGGRGRASDRPRAPHPRRVGRLRPRDGRGRARDQRGA